MNEKSIIKTKIWLILISGIILALLSIFTNNNIVSNILLGLGTGVVTSFIVALLIEYRHERNKKSLLVDLRKDFFNSVSYIIKDLFFTFRSYKFDCSKLNAIEYLNFVSNNIDDKNSIVVNHTTLYLMNSELAYQNINTKILRIMAIITEEEEKKVNNLIFRIRELNEHKATCYIDLKAFYETVQKDILTMPEFSDFLFLDFSFISGGAYTVISINENCPFAERIKSSDLFEPLFR